MFDFIRKLWEKHKEDEKNFVYNYNGILFISIERYFCNKEKQPGPYELLEAFKKHLKANGIELYADRETFSKFINNVMLSYDFEIFLDSLYLTAYEYPNEKLIIYPGEEFQIGVMLTDEPEVDISEDIISSE